MVLFGLLLLLIDVQKAVPKRYNKIQSAIVDMSSPKQNFASLRATMSACQTCLIPFLRMPSRYRVQQQTVTD
jgi:hypothetical protein